MMKQRMRFNNVGLMVLVMLACLSSVSTVYCDETIELERRQAVENAEIQKIQSEGLGNRFKIAEIKPETTNGVVCSFNIEMTEAGNWLLKALYPKDVIPMKMAGPVDGGIVTGKGSYFTQAGDISLLNANSILRFCGKVTLEGIVFEGEKDNPLTFVLLDNGLTYVIGKGRITLNNGESVSLPN